MDFKDTEKLFADTVDACFRLIEAQDVERWERMWAKIGRLIDVYRACIPPGQTERNTERMMCEGRRVRSLIDMGVPPPFIETIVFDDGSSGAVETLGKTLPFLMSALKPGQCFEVPMPVPQSISPEELARMAKDFTEAHGAPQPAAVPEAEPQIDIEVKPAAGE